MDDRTNTIAGWVLAGCAAALGLSIVGGMIFHGEEPEKEGYAVEAAAEAGGGAAAEVPIAALLPAGDAAKGAEVFKKCAACHTVTQGGAAGIGPNLWGTLGKPVAGQAGFAYSDALKAIGGNWDFEKMNAWLTSPRKFANGTKMTFAGLSNPQDRANILIYLNQQGSNLPLPAAPAAGAPAAGDAAANGAAAAEGNAAAQAVANATGADTGAVANTAVPAAGAPSVDPNAAREAAARGN